MSRPHAHLEGLRKCGKCHRLGDREVRDKCLECHGEIAAMRDGGTGLHAGDGFGECVECHVEHQGREYELVYWPAGQAGFDHGAVGYPLTGGHARPDCRACHKEEHIADAGSLRSAGKDPNRTFLGLATACTACHADPHAGQFKQDCTACHDTGTWKPAPLFDHSRTTYPLTGRHLAVDCAKCHVPAAPDRAVVFAGVAHATCTDCHRDPHAGALGPRCIDCHTTADWRQVQGGAFDHDRTRYPLRGRHAAVTCAACHGERGPRPAFARCVDCHRDEHGGGARGRPAWTRCEDCHTVQGYAPAGFTVADHDSTEFPLREAHLAAPCLACHRPAERLDLAPTAAACTDCHADPHRWRAEAPTCTGCHTEASWRAVAYDHGPTGFALTGRHAAATCAACHLPADADKLGFGGEARTCAGCHADVHGGTMTVVAGETAGPDCARCHVTVDWLAEKFEHDRDSAFALAGAHAGVACRACHPAPTDGAPLAFRPLGTACASCHPVLPPVPRSAP